jgi:CRP-like cAMP-binding protein
VRRLRFRRGEVILRKGEIGDRFYVIASGSAAVELEGRTVGRLGEGGWFGEVALLRNSARTATVKMTSDGEVASLARHHFLRALALDGSAEHAAITSIRDLPGMARAPVETRTTLANSETSTVLRSVPLLENLPEPSLEALREGVSRTAVAAGEAVFYEGDPAAAFFVVLAGTLVVNVGGEDVRDIGPGDWFGELGLLRGQTRTSTVRASTAALLLSMPGEAFLIAVGESPADAAWS